MKQKLLLAITCIAFLTTTAQVTKVKEINNSGTSNSSPNNLFVFNNKIYFGADDSNGSNSPGNADLGRELWATDGTEAGTTFVKDLRTGTANSSPGNFFELSGSMYFSANSGGGNALHSSDGTETGTTATGGSFVFNPIELNGLIYYINTVDSNGLYTFDGTTQTKVSNTGTEDVQFIGGTFTTINSRIIGYGETAADEPTIGRELYSYDPATATYTLIKDIATGTKTSSSGVVSGNDSSISNFVIIGTEIYFEADNALWKTDGTTNGTIEVTAASSLTFLANFYNWNDKLYFEGDDGSDDQLWQYDPTADTLVKLSSNTTNHDPSDFTPFGSYLYYAAEVSGDSSQYLFRTDGTTVESLDTTIKDIDDIVLLNGKLYFEGDDGVTGNELYSFDPATLSTETNSLEIVKVFPNPTSDFIQVPNSLLGQEFVLYSILGKVVKKGKIITTKISVASLSKGNYILKMTTDLNTITKKIIIE